MTVLSLFPQVGESLQRQEELVRRLEAAHGQFVKETQSAGTSARDNVLKELAAGYDTYQELSSNLQEGTQVCPPVCLSVCMIYVHTYVCMYVCVPCVIF